MTPDYTRATRIAYKTLLALHIETLPIDPLMILSYCKNTSVHTYAEVMNRMGRMDYASFKTDFFENKDALTVRRDFGNGIIGYEMFYDSRAPMLRRRFTLAHELGHILLKHSMEERWEESEANCFASQLLAPRPVFDLLSACGIDVSDASAISRVFDISKTASAIAIDQCTNQDPALCNLVRKQFAVLPMAI